MNFYLLGHMVLWLAKVVEDFVRISDLLGLYQLKREGNWVSLVQRGQNYCGRFLKLIEFGNGAKNGFLVIPEGCKSCG